MKNSFLALLIFCTCLTAGSIISVSSADVYEQEFRIYLVTSGSFAPFDAELERLFALSGDLPEDRRAEIRARGIDELVKLLAPAYRRIISLEDLNRINAFYRTPAGQHLANAQQRLRLETSRAMLQWTVAVQSAIDSDNEMSNY